MGVSCSDGGATFVVRRTARLVRARTVGGNNRGITSAPFTLGATKVATSAPGLEKPDSLRRHVRYGVQDAHYETVGAALLWTLERGLGEAFTPAVREAWAETYTVLATVMKGATRGEA